MMAAPPPAAAGGGTEGKKRRRAPAKKGKDALKKQATKDADGAVGEEDIVWEAVVVPEAANGEEEGEAQDEDAQELAGRLASDEGHPPRPSGPMIRRHVRRQCLRTLFHTVAKLCRPTRI